MHTSQRAHQKARDNASPIWIDRETRNKIAREYLTWSLRLDHQLGRRVTADDEPYCHYGREAVERLIANFDPSMVEAEAAPKRKPRKRAPTKMKPHAAEEVRPRVPVVFREDTVDDLFR
jgi:hypothetical protein